MPEPFAQEIPVWLAGAQNYEPKHDHDSFITKSILSMTAVLSHFRIDDGKAAPFSPNAALKLIMGFVCILLTSCATNYFFTLIMLACVLIRLACMPTRALKKSMALALSAGAASFLLMLGAILLGQSQSVLLISTKVFISVSIAMCVALSTPFNELTAALAKFHVPGLFIMTIDLALKNIVSLGTIALQILYALRLRSVGKNKSKGSALSGIGAILLLKSKEKAQTTYEAMCCRGFSGEYHSSLATGLRKVDILWLFACVGLIVLFIYLQGAL